MFENYHSGTCSVGPSRSSSLASFNLLSPVAEESEHFKFDAVTSDLQLDKALTAIMADDINSISSQWEMLEIIHRS